jgi:formylmethanofuran dehydrogenase subunit B
LARQVLTDVVCAFCGCGCDNLEVIVEQDRILSVKHGCAISVSKYLNYQNERNLTPLIRSGGKLKKTTYARAIDKVAKILANSHYPLLYGWSSTSNEAIRIGVQLAETVGGVIDNTTSICHGPTILGLQDIGEATCTLGEVRHRADLIVYWGSNPVHSHPNHMLRYTVMRQGRFRRSRKERKMIVVDVRRTDTARLADRFVQIEPNADYELLTALRMAIRGDDIEVDSVAGVPVETIEELADIMISCEFGVIFFGVGLTMSMGKHRNVDAALSLVRDLNSKTKFLIMPMRGWFNVTGADHVSAWITGYPYAVDLSRGYPRYNPGDTSAIEIASRGECDSALIVASDPISNFPAQAAKHLTKIPLITVDPHITSTTLASDVVLPSTFTGIETAGNIYRMDGVPLATRKLIDPPKGLRSDVEILEAIIKRVKKIKRGSS